MQYVYALRLKDGAVYIGCTGDIKRRVNEHKKGYSKYTKLHCPLLLVYFEAYANKADAFLREKYLKSGDGRQELKKQLKHTLSI